MSQSSTLNIWIGKEEVLSLRGPLDLGQGKVERLLAPLVVSPGISEEGMWELSVGHILIGPISICHWGLFGTSKQNIPKINLTHVCSGSAYKRASVSSAYHL